MVKAVMALSAWGGLGLVGCGSSNSTGPSGTGSLTVTITAPAGVTPSVAVSGPGGYQQSLTATQTLSGLAAGSYTVTAAAVAVSNPIVATVYAGTVTGGGTANVSSGATATASVSYAVQPGSGALWVANSGGPTLAAYTAAQLGASTGAAPATALADGGVPYGAAFDFFGNLWIANFGNSTLVEFSASQFGASGSPTPAVTLSATAGSLNSPVGLTFDLEGDLWVANAGSSTVIEFSASQLGASGSPTPAVTLSATAGGSLNGPEGLAFSFGNLWVANNGSNTVVEIIASQLTSGSPPPAVTLSATAGSLNGPAGLAFDADGFLWVANASGNTVVQFAGSQLEFSGAPAPRVTLSSSSLVHPFGLAFDPAPPQTSIWDY